MLRLSILLLMGLITATVLTCQDASTLESYLQQHHENGQLNGNVLVLKAGEVFYEQSYGFADGSQQRLLTAKDRFNIGSIYKEFPAVATMQLHQQGKIGLNHRLYQYLPDLPEWATQVTIEQLLQYAAGLPRVNWGAYFGKNLPVTADDLWHDINAIEQLEFSPGTDYLYTNFSPFLLTKIIEKISGQAFESYVKDHLITPYQLEHLLLTPSYPYRDKTDMAIPFNEDGEEDSYQIELPSLLFSATTQDLSRWFSQLDAGIIVDQKSLQILSKQAKSGSNIQSPLGGTVWKNDQLVEHRHHGSSGNYECLVHHFVTEQILIIVLTNHKKGNVDELVEGIKKRIR